MLAADSNPFFQIITRFHLLSEYFKRDARLPHVRFIWARSTYDVCLCLRFWTLPPPVSTKSYLPLQIYATSLRLVKNWLTPLPPQCICTRPHGHLALLPEIALDRTTAAVYFVVQQWPASPFLV